MKTIFFVRHAKSSWDNVELTDEERPLNQRGLKDAPKMAGFISEKIKQPDILITSSALRTHQTAKIFEKAFHQIPIKIESQLYNASEVEWFTYLKNLNEDYSSAMMFGHNPTLTQVVNIFSDSNIMNIPTCGVASISFKIDSWKEILDTDGILDFYHYPKGI
jgi:phosphohistidine phosphatase